MGVLHAKQLHDTDDDFEGWSVLKKQAFVSRVCGARNPHIMMGLNMSVEKGTSKSIEGKAIGNTEGVAYILECGHENNAEVEKKFYTIKQQNPILPI